MICRDTKENYGCITKWIHGIIAVLILFQILCGVFLDYVPIYTFHKSMGIVILFLMIFFVIWRLTNPKPVWPPELKPWEKCLARFVHICLYGGFILMPLSGWVMATAAGKAPHFFWLFKAPFPGISLSKPLAGAAGEMHGLLAWILSILLVIHILGALKHHFIDKNTIMKRICPHAKDV